MLNACIEGKGSSKKREKDGEGERERESELTPIVGGLELLREFWPSYP